MYKCCVYGCNNTPKDTSVVFFRIPPPSFYSNANALLVNRRNLWIKAIRRDRPFPKEELKDARVCSKHFISGAPAPARDQLDPDYVPSLFLGFEDESSTENITLIIESPEGVEKMVTVEANESSETLGSYDPLTITKQELIDIKSEHLFYDSELFAENSSCNDYQEDKAHEVKNSVVVKQLKDLENICRGCLCTDDVANMNEAIAEGTSAVIMYEAVTNAKINITHIPAKMCVSCISALVQTYKFVNMLEKSFQFLNQSVINLKIKNLWEHNYSKSNKSDSQLTDTVADQQTVDDSSALEPLLEPVVDNSLLRKTLMGRTLHNSKKKLKRVEATVAVDIQQQFLDDDVIVKTESTEETLSTDEKDTDMPKVDSSHSQGSKGTRRIVELRSKNLISKRKVLKGKEKVLLAKKNIPKVDPKKNGKYTCNRCENVEYEDYTEIDKHFRDHHTDQPNCILCKNQFKNYWLVISHMAMKHAGLKCCRVCLITFNTYNELLAHYKSPEHNTICNMCDQSFNSTRALYNHRITAHADPHTPKSYKCPECPKSFSDKSNINRHVRVFHRDIRFRCDTCGKDYTTKLALNNHIRVSHKGEKLEKKVKKKYICELCGQNIWAFNNWAIAVHNARHKGHKFICRRCRESFVTNDELNKHVAEKNHELFKCEQCPNEFIREEMLKNHVKNHSIPGWDDEAGQRKQNVRRYIIGKSRSRNQKAGYNCEFCGRFCNTLQYLINHRRVHTNERPFECEVCHKGFKTWIHKQTHLAIHLGIKKWVCKHCGKAFTNQGNMVMHEKIHTGEKPHKCPECEKGFITGSAMRKHAKTHFKTKPVKMRTKVLRKRAMELSDTEDSENSELFKNLYKNEDSADGIDVQEENDDVYYTKDDI